MLFYQKVEPIHFEYIPTVEEYYLVCELNRMLFNPIDLFESTDEEFDMYYKRLSELKGLLQHAYKLEGL